MCSAAQFHLSVWSPEYNQYLCSLSQSTRKEDSDRDSDHNLLPVGVLLDTEWRCETVPCQSEQCHCRGPAAMMRPDSYWCYFNSRVDTKKQHSCRKTCIRPCADGWRVLAFDSICLNYWRNTTCRNKRKRSSGQIRSFFSFTVVIVNLLLALPGKCVSFWQRGSQSFGFYEKHSEVSRGRHKGHIVWIIYRTKLSLSCVFVL